MRRLLVVMMGFAISGTALAGKYEDEQSFELEKADSVVIRAQVTTTPTRSGNKSSVVLYVDGIEVDRVGGDRAEHTLSHRWSKKGKHVARAVCSNEGADAKTCEINIQADEVRKF